METNLISKLKYIISGAYVIVFFACYQIFCFWGIIDLILFSHTRSLLYPILSQLNPANPLTFSIHKL
jgi:hypothetical protein